MTFTQISLICLLITLGAINIVTPLENQSNNLERLQTNLKQGTLTRDSLATTVTSIQDVVNNVILLLGDLVSTILPNITTIALTVQQDVVTPLLTLVNILAALPTVQLAEPVYVIVLVLQTVLNIANLTLLNADEFSGTTTVIITTVQAVSDTIFSFILSFLV